jgi:hypothetical protein
MTPIRRCCCPHRITRLTGAGQAAREAGETTGHHWIGWKLASVRLDLAEYLLLLD